MKDFKMDSLKFFTACCVSQKSGIGESGKAPGKAEVSRES